jgi:hypothetical protein
MGHTSRREYVSNFILPRAHILLLNLYTDHSLRSYITELTRVSYFTYVASILFSNSSILQQIRRQESRTSRIWEEAIMNQLRYYLSNGWSDWEKLWKTSVKIAGVLSEIRTVSFRNIYLKRQLYTGFQWRQNMSLCLNSSSFCVMCTALCKVILETFFNLISSWNKMYLKSQYHSQLGVLQRDRIGCKPTHRRPQTSFYRGQLEKTFHLFEITLSVTG